MSGKGGKGTGTLGGIGGTGGRGGAGGVGGGGGNGGGGGDGRGGGVYLSTNTAALTNDTLSGNRASGGAGGGGGTAGASGTGTGGGLYVTPPITIGIVPLTSGGISLANSLIAGNVSSTSAPDVAGTVSSSDRDLIGNTSGSSGFSAANGDILNPSFVGLGALANNGGPTQTMALLPGSPAIDAGDNSSPIVSLLESAEGVSSAADLTDQLGDARIAGKSIDIGAREYQYGLGLSGQLASGSAPGTVQFSCTVTNNGPDAVSGAILTVPLPAGVVFSSLTVPSGWNETDPGSGKNGTVTFTDSNLLDSGQSATFTITAQLQNPTDGADLAATATVGPTAWGINPQNNSLTLTVSNAQEGQAFNQVKLFHFTDANANETANDFSASVAWGDGSSNSSSDGTGTGTVVADPNGGFDVLGTHAYLEEGRYALTVAVSGLDDAAYRNISQQLFVVADASLTAGALTPPPHATINQPYTNILLFHFTDANPNAAASDHTAAINWGDGTITTVTSKASSAGQIVSDPAGGFDVLGSYTYTHAVFSGTFRVQVTDAGGSTTSASVSNFKVLNQDQPLTSGTLSVPSVTTEGQSISNQLLFHFTDPDPDGQVSDYEAVVSWGDDTFNSSDDNSGSVQVVADPKGGFNVFGSHTYSKGSFYLAVKVTDQADSRASQPDNGGQIAGAASAKPLIITDLPGQVKPGTPFTATAGATSGVQSVATFSDPGGPQSESGAYVALIQWGDGTVTEATLGSQANYAGPNVAASLVPVVNAPTVSSSGGSLATGTYYYTVTSTTANGESTPSHEVSATTTGSASAVTLSWSQVAGATGYRIYRGTSPGAEDTVIANIASGTTLSFTNTGSELTYAAQPQQISGHDIVSSSPTPGIVLGSDGKNFSVNLAHQYAEEGHYSVTITIDHNGILSQVTNTANVSGPATKLVATTQPPGSVGVNQPFTLTVSAEDAAGTVDPTFNGAVTVALQNNPSGATLGGTVTVNAVNGVATFAGLTINQPGIGYTLQVTTSGLTGTTTAAVTVFAHLLPPPPPSPAPPPTLHTPPLLAFFDALLHGVETINSNDTETVVDSIFGFPLLISTYDGAGNLMSVTLFGMNVTLLFELL